MKKCMICERPVEVVGRGDANRSWPCPHCDTEWSHYVEDDDDVVGITDARQLTILTIDIDD